MKRILLDVKPFRETLDADMCGPASLKILLEYYDVIKSEEELAKMAGHKKELGTDDKGIERAAKKLGFKVKIKNNSSYKDIEKWLKKDVPVIVDWFTKGRVYCGDSSTADGHYSVVMGLDDEFICLQDPELGTMRKIARDDFMRVWFDFRGKYLKPNELILRQIVAIYK